MSELRDDVKLLEFEAASGGAAAEVREVVLVGFADASDEAVQAKAFKGMRDLRGRLAEFEAKVFVAKS